MLVMMLLKTTIVPVMGEKLIYEVLKKINPLPSFFLLFFVIAICHHKILVSGQYGSATGTWLISLNGWSMERNCWPEVNPLLLWYCDGEDVPVVLANKGTWW